MSIRLMSLVWDKAPFAGAELLMFLALADRADDEGFCYPGVKSLAEKCRISDRQAQRILHGLQESGWLTIKTKGGPYGTNLYQIQTARLREAPSAVKHGDIAVSPGVVTFRAGGGDIATSPNSSLIDSPLQPVGGAPPPAPERPVAVASPIPPDYMDIYAQVTGCVGIPYGELPRVLHSLDLLWPRHPTVGDIVAFLKPFYQTFVGRRNKDGRQYSRLNTAWLDWAVAGSIPPAAHRDGARRSGETVDYEALASQI